MEPPRDGKQTRGMDLLKLWQARYFELNDDLIWQFLKEVEELSLTDYSEEQIRNAFSQTRKLREVKQVLSNQNMGTAILDTRLTLDQALEEISKLSFISEDNFGSISEDNLATQAYSSHYLDSVSGDDSYSDNGLVSEEEILSGLQRESDDNSVPEEQLDYAQFVHETNNAYKEGDS